ncbi:tail fiber assembly protein [Dickeya dianthicola]
MQLVGVTQLSRIDPASAPDINWPDTPAY